MKKRRLVKIYTRDPVHDRYSHETFWRFRGQAKTWRAIRRHIMRLECLGYDRDVSIEWG